MKLVASLSCFRWRIYPCASCDAPRGVRADEPIKQSNSPPPLEYWTVRHRPLHGRRHGASKKKGYIHTRVRGSLHFASSSTRPPNRGASYAVWCIERVLVDSNFKKKTVRPSLMGCWAGFFRPPLRPSWAPTYALRNRCAICVGLPPLAWRRRVVCSDGALLGMISTPRPGGTFVLRAI